MRKTTAALLMLLVPGCVAQIHDPDETVATYNLVADHLEALLIQECVDRHGETGCTPLPNEMECETMKIMIKADGRTMVDCWANGQLVHSGYAGIGDGVPILCKATADMGCQTCMDVYGNSVLDTCNRATQLFRSSQTGWGDAPAGTAFLTEPTGAPTVPPPPDQEQTPPQDTPPPEEASPTPPSNQSGHCDPANAALLYAKELNKILAHEGLNFSWVPEMSKFADPNKGFFADNGGSNGNLSCQAFTANIKSKLHKCANVQNGECFYCYYPWFSNKKTCRCYRINVAAIKAACAQVPPDCDNQAWSAMLIQSYGIANTFMFSPSYENFYGKVETPGGGAEWPKCKGSPLVLDLAGDGIRATAPEAGVQFDLLGHGALQTAWVEPGDDALLALDRDGNGLIDNGTELFGEAFAGLPREDGFDALAELDENRDGRVDSRDPMFQQLRLWQDRNGDGVSQSCELRSLPTAGVSSLTVGAHLVAGKQDRHGNDLSRQGGFTRDNGTSGLMVDVFFVTE